MQDCFHGKHHEHHRHQHAGLAEGMERGHLKRLRLVMLLSAVYLAVQVLGGYWSGSLALLAEAGHKFSDVSFIGLALIAAWFAGLSPTPQRTFGYARVEIIAAFLNGLALLWVSGFILYEAYEGLAGGHHHHVEGNLMLIVAGAGFLINLTCLRALHAFVHENLNVKSAFYHIMADLMGSAGTVISALLIIFFDLHWADLVLSVLISLMVLVNGIRLAGHIQSFDQYSIRLQGPTPQLVLKRVVATVVPEKPGRAKGPGDAAARTPRRKPPARA